VKPATECRKIDMSGKIRIPKEFREQLGIEYGDWVEFAVNENGNNELVLIARPVRAKRSGSR
jgi:AbrB family looped-hinge helix DNA binding protein